jgi:hypothetical protein
MTERPVTLKSRDWWTALAGGEKELIELIENIVSESKEGRRAGGTNELQWGRSRGRLILQGLIIFFTTLHAH